MINAFTCSFRSQWRHFSCVHPAIQKMFPEGSQFFWRNLMWGFRDVKVNLQGKTIIVSEREFFSRLQALVSPFPVKTLPATVGLSWLEDLVFYWRGKRYQIRHVFDPEDHDYGWYIV